MADPVVTLYSRPGCHLCTEAASLLDALAREFGFQVETVNVEQDPLLEARYGEAVPVITYAGVEVARAPIHAQTLRAALQARLAL